MCGHAGSISLKPVLPKKSSAGDRWSSRSVALLFLYGVMVFGGAHGGSATEPAGRVNRAAYSGGYFPALMTGASWQNAITQ